MKEEIITINFSMKRERIEDILLEIRKGTHYVLNETNGKSDEIFYLAPEWFINILKAYSQSIGVTYNNYFQIFGFKCDLQPHYKNELVVFNKNYIFNQKCSNYVIQLNFN